MENVVTITREAARAIVRTLRIRLVPIFPVFEVLWPAVYAHRLAHILAVPPHAFLNYLGPYSNPAVKVIVDANRAWVRAVFGLPFAPFGQDLESIHMRVRLRAGQPQRASTCPSGKIALRGLRYIGFIELP